MNCKHRIGAAAARWARRLAVALAGLGAAAQVQAQVQVGLTEIAATAGHGPVTVFYPAAGEPRPVVRGPFTMDAAPDALPVRGNGRLVIVSHGSPASPWVYADLARALVGAGFVVALPEHFADNHKDDSEPGPPSWKRRPQEVSRAIDALAADARFAPLLALDRVGVYGMSAGGHTALTLAGGRWSPAQLLRHCEAHIADDFHACAGPTTRLTGGWLDGIKTSIALGVIRQRLADEQWYAHSDPRIAAAVAGVPFAADFDPASFARLGVPLALVTARHDTWLVPRFHAGAVLQACPSCIHLADLPSGGHGALLSPLPPGRDGLIGQLVGDPPGFDRAREVPALNARITGFFVRQLAPPDPR